MEIAESLRHGKCLGTRPSCVIVSDACRDSSVLCDSEPETCKDGSGRIFDVQYPSLLLGL